MNCIARMYEADYNYIRKCVKNVKKCVEENARSNDPLPSSHVSLNFPSDVEGKIKGLLDVVAVNVCASVPKSYMCDRPFTSMGTLEPQPALLMIELSNLADLHQYVQRIVLTPRSGVRFRYRPREAILVNYFLDYQKIEGDLEEKVLVGVRITDFSNAEMNMEIIRMSGFLVSKSLQESPCEEEDLRVAVEKVFGTETGCGHCRKNDSGKRTKLRSCSRCGEVRYCSKTCQRNDWQRHKPECREK